MHGTALVYHHFDVLSQQSMFLLEFILSKLMFHSVFMLHCVLISPSLYFVF
jgi:hypothetical protein